MDSTNGAGLRKQRTFDRSDGLVASDLENPQSLQTLEAWTGAGGRILRKRPVWFSDACWLIRDLSSLKWKKFFCIFFP